MGFIDEIRNQLNGMGALERQQAIVELREVIYEDAYAQSRPTSEDVTACPSCGSVSVVRKGHDRDGIQRWMCKDRHRTFRNTPDTAIMRLKLRPAVWMMYLECFVDCLALRECVKRCKVSLRTAWLMRMRLIESIKRHLPKFLAGAGASVQLDETYLRESFKGNHTHGKFRLPREAHHRGTPASKRGLSREQICVMSGVSDDDSAFLTMSGHGVISKAASSPRWTAGSPRMPWLSPIKPPPIPAPRRRWASHSPRPTRRTMPSTESTRSTPSSTDSSQDSRA